MLQRGLTGGQDSTRHRTGRGQFMMKDASSGERINSGEENSRVVRTQRDIERGAVKS